MDKLKISIVGASGYGGGELLRLLLSHPHVEIFQVTSERNAGKKVTIVHPNLRGRTPLRFCSVTELESCDLLFVGLPHGRSMEMMPKLRELAPRIIDLSGDFRLSTAEDYKEWYDHEHTHPEWLKQYVYGIPELHREEMKKAKYISSAGCNATCTILGLYPLIKKNLIDLSRGIFAEAKVGSSEAGNKPSLGSHHAERTFCVRSFKPVGHRHVAEMLQELSLDIQQMHFSGTSIQLVRGILVTSHVFLKEGVTEKDVLKAYIEVYRGEPFIRLIRDKVGVYRYPEPKILAGTNYCDIGFAFDAKTRRLVVMSAIDNLMKGAAGQAMQAMNLQNGFEEDCGLEFPGLHPI
jgi:LysW-gamma-L-alpha-aminoadipyl-6-phosphate/LysW-L-glutamyl-5-phosphate reductase